MKSIFDNNATINFIERINNLDSNASAKWGKMNAYQMIKHCILSENMYLGNKKYDRLFIGKLFGKMALKKMIKDDSILKQGQPTHPTFVTKGNGSIAQLKNEWIDLVQAYNNQNKPELSAFVHPFFGSMTKEQLGISVYKHIDHHLRQFGV